MGLSKEELQFIDTYLVNSDVDYIDVRLELTDHISTAIEQELEGQTTRIFYDAFKDYMIRHKKDLMKNCEVQKTKLRDKIVMKFLKSFISLEVLFLVFLSAILIDTFNFINYQEYFIRINFGLLIFALISYYTIFYRTRKTSVGSSLLSLVAICYYIIIYVKNPLDLFFLIPTLAFGYKLSKVLKNRIDETWRIVLIVLTVVLLFPLFFWFDSWSQQFVTDKIIVGYFFLQLIIWYMLFKVLLRYKLELDKKFEVIFR